MLEIAKLNTYLVKDQVFWFCAFAGTGMFVIQLLMNFFGSASHEGIDDGSNEIDSGKFKWLSKQAITGFLMMFGWVGLTCRKEFGLSEILTVLIALVGGLIAIISTGFIFRFAKKLQSSGTVFSIEDAIGKEAMIYLRIPNGGIGKVSVSLNNFTHEIDAISYIKEDLLSFTPVQIIKKADDHTVVVVPSK